jgi:hypothetical protein
MEWWSAQRNDNKKSKSPLVELANTTSSVKSSTKRGIIVQAQAASPSILGGFHPLPKRQYSLRLKTSAVAMLCLLHQGENAPKDFRRASPAH